MRRNSFLFYWLALLAGPSGLAALSPPETVIARATRPDYVFVSWDAVGGAAEYQVFRSAGGVFFRSGLGCVG